MTSHLKLVNPSRPAELADVQAQVVHAPQEQVSSQEGHRPDAPRVDHPSGGAHAWLLGQDWKQRLRTLRSLGAAVFYALAIVLMYAGVAHQMLPATGVHRISLSIGLTCALFYAVLRSGLNQRFKAASLTMPQMVVAVTYAALIYTMGGLPRNVILLVMVPLLTFGFHHLRALQTRLLSGYTLATMGVAMIWLVHTQPGSYDMGKELVRFMILAVVVVTLWQITNHEVEEASGVTKAVMRLVFTDDSKQRLRIQRSLVAAANVGVLTLLLGYTVSVGIVQPFEATLLGAYMVFQSVAFYLVLRTGLNRRFADPALTLPQILSAIVCVVGAYSILGEVRGSSLLLISLVLVFGMFNLSAHQTRMASLFALVLQGSTMLAMSWLAPQRYPVREELIHFLMVCTALPTISVLAGQLSDLRARLRARKNELAAALERIQTLATRDELTGLINRRHMNETLALQKKFSDKGGRVFCIGILDIDHFKRINDSYGHAVGDEVLRNFAQAVQQTLRDSDVVARWGGEEFLLMLTDCRIEQARMGLERVRERVNAAMVNASHPELRITFSSGLTEQRYEEGLDATIERADQALYRAKRRGRNRTVIA